MPLKIEFFDENYRQQNNNLALPIIQITPTGNSNPYLYSVVYTVKGKNLSIAKTIQNAYPKENFPSGYQLKNPLRITPKSISSILNSSINCLLQVDVEYSESDIDNSSDLSNRKHIADSYPLRAITSESQKDNNSDKKQILPKDYVPQQTKTNEENITMSNEKETITYPSWFAIDLGTSNSTVTLHDFKTIPVQTDFPKDQKEILQQRLAQWFDLPINETICSIHESDWQDFLTNIANTLNIKFDNENIANTISDFLKENDSNFLDFICKIETCLSSTSADFRLAVQKQLSAIYTEVFQTPPLEAKTLFPVILNKNRKEPEISSEIKIIKYDDPLQLIMGEKARQDRRQDIGKASSKAKEDNISWEAIEGRYHHSPKRYFSQDKTFNILENKEVSANQIIKSAYNQLIQLTKEYRDGNATQFMVGDFNSVIVTYPTVASPLARRDLENMMTSLGFDHVYTDYDEAVAVAIFYLFREFGGNLNIGIESFKTRCYRDGDKWVQNVLVIDIGGGTTDIALIELCLEELDPANIFDPSDDRGLGGRYYILTPKILGSSGHPQLGGELITLKVFLWLKVAIVDHLLTAFQNNELESDILESKIETLPDSFKEKGKFKSGSLLKCFNKERPELEKATYGDVLNVAETIIPTQWKKNPERLQTFYTLWDLAEETKLILGKSQNPNFVVSKEKIEEILVQSNILRENYGEYNLEITLTQEQLQKIVKPVIEEAVDIAHGLTENCLKGEEINNLKSKVHWLILSGKTCNLPQVKQEIHRKFSKSQHFIWNPERITFEPKHTKQATSIGACYAETLRQRIFKAKDAKKQLKEGSNQLDIRIKNLFYYLPCSFVLIAQNNKTQTLFETGTKLTQIDQDLMVKARTLWEDGGIQISTGVQRQDFPQSDPRNWGNFKGENIANLLGLDADGFREQIKAQFEINQKLEFKLYLCREGKPHYLIPAKLPSININSVIDRSDAWFTSEGVTWKIAVDKGTKELPKNGDIAVNVIESYLVDSPENFDLLFEVTNGIEVTNGKNLELKEFHYEDDETKIQKGLISEPLSPFPRNGKHTFYLCLDNNWLCIGELSQPQKTTDLPCDYRVTFDSKGDLRIHAGEIPYWTFNDPQCLKEKGKVYVTELELQPNEFDEQRDPFSGLN